MKFMHSCIISSDIHVLFIYWENFQTPFVYCNKCICKLIMQPPWSSSLREGDRSSMNVSLLRHFFIGTKEFPKNLYYETFFSLYLACFIKESYNFLSF